MGIMDIKMYSRREKELESAKQLLLIETARLPGEDSVEERLLAAERARENGSVGVSIEELERSLTAAIKRGAQCGI